MDIFLNADCSFNKNNLRDLVSFRSKGCVHMEWGYRAYMGQKRGEMEDSMCTSVFVQSQSGGIQEREASQFLTTHRTHQ